MSGIAASAVGACVVDAPRFRPTAACQRRRTGYRRREPVHGNVGVCEQREVPGARAPLRPLPESDPALARPTPLPAARRDDHRRQPALGPAARARARRPRPPGRRREDARVPGLVRRPRHLASSRSTCCRPTTSPGATRAELERPVRDHRRARRGPLALPATGGCSTSARAEGLPDRARRRVLTAAEARTARQHGAAHQPGRRLRRPHARSRMRCAASCAEHDGEGGSLESWPTCSRPN